MYISLAEDRWVNTYYDALKKYNNTDNNTIKIEPKLEKRHMETSKKSCNLSQMMYINRNKKGRN